MRQERLNNLAILAIVCELAKQVVFKDIIKKKDKEDGCMRPR